MGISSKFIWIFGITVITLFSCKGKESESLKEFSGRVLKVTPQILQVVDCNGSTIMFDNRKVTYVSGALMKNDSVCVSYRGELNNGTEAIIAELIKTYKTVE